jgi:hypothetical protein
MADCQFITLRADRDPRGVLYLPIPMHEGFRAGEDGTILSLFDEKGVLTYRWRRVPLKVKCDGYVTATLRSPTGSVTRLVHHLVLEAFVGPRPPGMEACHFPDKSPKNNRMDNLRWDTQAGNIRDRAYHLAEAKRLGLHQPRMRKRPAAPMVRKVPPRPKPEPGPEPCVADILRLFAEGIGVGLIAFHLNVPTAKVKRVLRDAALEQLKASLPEPSSRKRR